MSAAREKAIEAVSAREIAVQRLARWLHHMEVSGLFDAGAVHHTMRNADENHARHPAAFEPWPEQHRAAEDLLNKLGAVFLEPALLAGVEATNVGRAIDENLLEDGDKADDAKAKYERIVGANTSNINAKLRLAEDCIRQHRGGRWSAHMQPFIDDKTAHPDHNIWAPGLVVTSLISDALAHTLDASRRFGDPNARGVIMRIQLPDGRMVRVQVTEER